MRKAGTILTPWRVMQQPPGAGPRWSADRMWWWDGTRWLPAGQAPVAPPPPPQPPPFYYVSPPLSYPVSPPSESRGLRIFLLVALAISFLLNGTMSVIGTIAVAGGDTEPISIALWVAFLFVAAVSGGGLAGVWLRRAWGRWVALAAGISLSVTFVGAVLGIPIIYGAARAPVGSRA